MRRLVLLIGALAVLGPSPARGQDLADVAWNEGEIETARKLYSDRLAADSSDQRALHRLALIKAWNQEYQESIALFDHLVDIAPNNMEALLDRAKVITWSEDYPRAYRAYGEILEKDPDNRGARLGLAQALSWSNRLDSAAAVYRTLVESDSMDVDGLRGLARMNSWKGDLILAEEGWRWTRAVSPDDLPARVGLSQTLRWQGRAGAAQELWTDVDADTITQRDALLELDYVNAVTGARVRPSFAFETDSDGNDIATGSISGSYRPIPRLDVSVSGYVRTASFNQEDRTSRGAQVGVSGELDPGWRVFAGLGASDADVTDAPTITSGRLGISSPGRYKIGGTLAYSRSALDATAPLIRNGVFFDQWSVNLRAQPARLWSISTGFSRAGFEGSEPNRRILWTGSITRRLTRMWAVSVRLRGFGFEKDLNDGYFDPDFYGIGVGAVDWRLNVRQWRLSAAAAYGGQKVRSDGEVKGTVWVNGNVTYELHPGRQLQIGAFYTSAGLQSFASSADYRYFALNLGANWVF